jgi:hypothetical protein
MKMNDDSDTHGVIIESHCLDQKMCTLYNVGTVTGGYTGNVI